MADVKPAKPPTLQQLLAQQAREVRKATGEKVPRKNLGPTTPMRCTTCGTVFDTMAALDRHADENRVGHRRYEAIIRTADSPG